MPLTTAAAAAAWGPWAKAWTFSHGLPRDEARALPDHRGALARSGLEFTAPDFCPAADSEEEEV